MDLDDLQFKPGLLKGQRILMMGTGALAILQDFAAGQSGLTLLSMD